MKKLNKRKGIFDKAAKGVFRRDLLKNKIVSIALLTLGCLSVETTGGDITVFMLMYALGVYLFFSKDNCIM